MGFLVVKAFARQQGWQFKEEKRFNALIVKGMLDGVEVHLVQPLTFMNLSGIAIRSYLDYFKLPVSSLVVITDDIALPFGQMRLKAMGSAGGHNGLKSIEQHLGTAHYKRLRMGIGHQGAMNLAEYVLEPFNLEELTDLTSIIDRGSEVLLRLIKEDIAQVMNATNTVPRAPPEESIDLTKPPVRGEEKNA